MPEAAAAVPFSSDEKIAQLEGLLAADPADWLGWFMLGKLYLDAGRAQDAAAAGERCLELRGTHSAAWRLAGDAHRKAGDKEKARSMYERGIAVAESNGDLQTVREMQAFLRKLAG